MSKNFEKDIERIRQVISDLERGGKHLDETMRLFEEGVSLVDKCRSYLEEAELVVEELAK